MASMRAEEAERFYEEDEDPRAVFAVFDTAEKHRMADGAHHVSSEHQSDAQSLMFRCFTLILSEALPT